MDVVQSGCTLRACQQVVLDCDIPGREWREAGTVGGGGVGRWAGFILGSHRKCQVGVGREGARGDARFRQFACSWGAVGERRGSWLERWGGRLGS